MTELISIFCECLPLQTKLKGSNSCWTEKEGNTSVVKWLGMVSWTVQGRG